ncbi:hypothetical protein ACSAZL_19975 [Methanosarcina sp. T3]|uniref:hypothetical protein n=1 Tax=Methanosarcina sp. T3 TaxID=3439062 RepID=UPI003F824B39
MENNAENFFFSEKGQQIVRNVPRKVVLKGSVFREAGNYLVSGDGREKLKLRSPLIRKLLNSGIQSVETGSPLRE